jgi:hypothetical protein
MASDMLAKLKDARDRGSLFDEGMLNNKLLANIDELLMEIVMLNHELAQAKQMTADTVDRSVSAVGELAQVVGGLQKRLDERGG